MPDWRRYVRERLRVSHLRPERAAEIVEDLAQQLEDAYRAALERGATAEEAEATTAREIQDWDRLARDLNRSQARYRLPLAQRAIDHLEAEAALSAAYGAVPAGKDRRSPPARALHLATECAA